MRKLLMGFLILGLCFYGGSELKNFETKATSLEESTENAPTDAQTNKIAYLTFDDGPSKTTNKILDSLKKYDVKATFFVIGASIEDYPSIFTRTVEEGHCICPHTYTHNGNIYKDVNSFFEDNEKCRRLLEERINTSNNRFFRFPGGSANRFGNRSTLREIRKEAFNRELCYVDWNISIEDSINRNSPTSSLLRTFRKQYKNQDRVIVLMHDGYYNTTTAEALPTIIKFLKREGYEFNHFGNISEEEYITLKRSRLVNRYEVK